MQQGQTLKKIPRAYKKAIGLIYFLDLKFFTLRMLCPIINPEMKFLADQRRRHNMSWDLTKTRLREPTTLKLLFLNHCSGHRALLSPGTNGVIRAGQQSLMTDFLRVCVFCFYMRRRSSTSPNVCLPVIKLKFYHILMSPKIVVS